MKKIALLITLSIINLTSGQNTTKLSGFVKNISIDTLIIAKSHKDLRYSGIQIPIKEDEMFTYSLEHNYIEEYSIVYKSDLKKGAWRPIIFFPNNKTIEFELYPAHEYDKNKIIGDDLGELKTKFQKLLGEKFSKKGNEIYKAIFKFKKGNDDYRVAKSRLDSLNRKLLEFHYNYFNDDESILGLNEYVSFLQNANQMMISMEVLKDYQGIHLRKELDHPLIERANNLYAALSEIKIGQNYINIVLTDKLNNNTMLSELITNKKFTIVDLWSPWCGPCIKKSLLLKENYSKISKNTQIISVVGGVNKIEKAENAINRFEYPWTSYLEISDKNNIWEKYGITNSGGAQFLLNDAGTILSINPELEELLKIIDAN